MKKLFFLLTLIGSANLSAEVLYIKHGIRANKFFESYGPSEGVTTLPQIGWSVVDSEKVPAQILQNFKENYFSEKSSLVFIDSILEEDLRWGLKAIDVSEAWKYSQGSKNILVAIIDSGIDEDHEALNFNLWENLGEIDGNGVDDDNNGYIDDIHGWDYYYNDKHPNDQNGHGTHVAGTIGGYSERKNLFGINHKISLLPLKMFGRSGSGQTSHAVQAIIYAADKGAHVINASWGGYDRSDMLEDAIKYAESKGALFVAAAGNNKRDNDSRPMFPASYELPSIISVASVSKFLNLSTFSNFGAESVDIGAPGEDIYSTFIKNRYKSLSGTSMACPHVAGAAALLLSQDPSLTIPEIKDLILMTTTYKKTLTGKVSTSGVLNIGSAMNRLVMQKTSQ